jgi:hypothetical protein
MRLAEFEDSTDASAPSVLASVLQHLRARGAREIGVDALVQMVQNTGSVINDSALEILAKNDPTVKNLVRSISDGRVMINQGDNSDEIRKTSEVPAEQRVQQMAQRATSRRQS